MIFGTWGCPLLVCIGFILLQFAKLLMPLFFFTSFLPMERKGGVVALSNGDFLVNLERNRCAFNKKSHLCIYIKINSI